MIEFEEIRKHYGTFSLDSRNLALHPDFWNRVLSNVLITRCEHIFWDGILIYSGFSMLFRSIKEGEKPPFYKFKMDQFNDLIAIETKEMETTRYNGKETDV